MRIRSNITQRRGGFDATMTPMIDVVFLLLVFFVWTASFQIEEQLLPSFLTTLAGSGEPSEAEIDIPDFEQVVVRILWDEGAPLWLVNDSPRGSFDEVAAMLTTLASLKADAPVIIDPDGPVPLEHVINAYDAARNAGFTEIQFAASEEI